MKIKFKVLLVLLVTLYFQHGWSQTTDQDSTQKKFYYEQGLNCTQFVKQYLSFNEGLISNMPYLLTGNVGYRKFGFRYGANYQISQTKNTSEGSSTSGNVTSVSQPTTNENNLMAMDLRAGLYYRKTYFKRLSISYGLDFLIANQEIKTKTQGSVVSGSTTTVTVSETKSNSTGIGYGPAIALNFKVWKNLLLGTEAALYYISGTSSQEGSSNSTSTTNLGGVNTSTFLIQTSKSKGSFGNTELRIPLTLFLYIRI